MANRVQEFWYDTIQVPPRSMGLERPGYMSWAKNLIEFLEPINIVLPDHSLRQMFAKSPILASKNQRCCHLFPC